MALDRKDAPARIVALLESSLADVKREIAALTEKRDTLEAVLSDARTIIADAARASDGK